MRRLIALVIALASLLPTQGLLLGAAATGGALLAGCGGSNETHKRPVDPRKNRPHASGPAATAAGKGTDLVTIKLQNPKWDIIQPYFEKYLAEKHTAPKDAFKPEMLKFIPRPTIKPKSAEPTEPQVEKEPKEDRGPLQQYPLKQYSLQIIMSGTAVPKAVVIDPKGEAFVIQRDTRIGDKGGIVESITQYMVVVKEPNTDKPVKMTIKPPFIDLATQVGLGTSSNDQGEELDVPNGTGGGQR